MFVRLKKKSETFMIRKIVRCKIDKLVSRWRKRYGGGKENNMRMRLLVLIVLAVGFVQVGVLEATNGYFSHGYGAKSKGMAGAGTALSLSTFDSISNPAAMVFLGKRFDLGVSLFMPDRGYTVSGNPSMYPGTFPLTPGTVDSDTTLFLIPGAGANFMLDPNTSLGFTAYGNGGMNTNYDTSTFHGTIPTGVNLSQLFMDVTVARKLGPNHSIGVTAIVAYQMFKAEGLQAFAGFSRDAANLTDNDTDNSFGFGFRVGYFGKFSQYLSVGASYQTKIKMSEFDKYAGLFAEQGDFDIPSTYNIGVAIHPTSQLTFAVDLQRINYSEVKSIANPLVPMNFYMGVLLGDDDGAGFAWSDITTVKFGTQYAFTRNLTLRAGFSTGDQPVSEVMFNILAPGVIERHITFGGTLKLAGNQELSFYVMHAFSNTVSGDNPMEAPGQQQIELRMHQWEFGVEYSF